MIVSKEINHVAITAPNLQFNKNTNKMELLPYNEKIGVFTGNAGWINGMMYMSDKNGFGSFDWKNPKVIKYWQFKKYDGRFDDE